MTADSVPTDTALAGPTPPPRRSGRGRRVAATLVLLPLVLLAALALWATQPGSLAAALALVGTALPAGQQLQTSGVRGTLTDGGQITHLTWQQGERRLQVDDLEVRGSLSALLAGRLELPRLQARQARWSDTRPSSAAPATAPTDLRLPLPVQIDWRLGQLELQGRTRLTLTDLAGQYRYADGLHRLEATRWQLAQGRYQLDARLQAQPPFTLDARASGDIASPLPAPAPPLRLQAQLEARGPLAQWQLDARLNPVAATATAAARQPQPQARLSAQIRPWATQPLAQAQGTWEGLNPALFWPGAPQGELGGQLQIAPGPANGSWAGELRLHNRASGLWNQGRWPLESLQLRALWQGAYWQVPQFVAQGAGGRLQGQATLQTPAPGQPPRWQAQATLQHLNPARIDSRWASLPLGGQIQASQAPGQPLQFDIGLQAEGPVPASGPALTALRQVQARGQWQPERLTLARLDVQTADARLQGQGHWQPSAQQGAGQWQLQAPGLSAQLDGTLGRQQGSGRIHLHLGDAAAAGRWLARWPGLTLPALDGQAELQGRWDGGWADRTRLQWQATLDVPRLAPAGPAPPWRVAELHAELSGPANALQLSLRSAGEWQGHPWRTEAQAQLDQSAPGQWQARLGRWQVQARPSADSPAWQIALAQPTRLTWQASPARLALEPGTLQLSSPGQGSAQIAWAASHWAQAAPGAGAAQWQTQGQIRDIPLAWLELAGGPALASLGLRGDLHFNGDWQASATPGLSLRATLARSRGDLSLQGDDERAAPLAAGIREAKLVLQAQGPQVSARLTWDSQRAGQAQISAQTELQSGPEGWSWPLQAPVRAQVRAQLPRVGLWSVLAPPGWRLRGTLDANASLSGTRAQPQWHGNLNADDLAVRSVAEGIEFGQGRLRTTLDNQRLGIDEFSLKGAGSNGGQLSARGTVLWPGESGRTGLQRLRMALDVQLQQLRVSARADRRLALSGQLNATLEQARLLLRGQLRADQALFILPDDSAPRLGADVVVLPRHASPAPAPATAGSGLPVQPDVQLQLDLGSDFALRGRGLDTRLAGQLQLTSQGRPLRPRLNGEIRTVGGSYQAYGQHLDITTGVLRFTGPYDNPGLDVLAIRPNLSQKVGVQVSGNVLLPRVRLWAESGDLTDADKLAWLVLGRAAANGGGESALLQQAALALLGGNGPGLSGQLAQALGLDELSVRGATTQSDGSTSAATVTVGKRLSRQFYVAYERSLAGALGTFYIFYDLSRRFTLRAQMGQQSAADLIFTLRYD